MKKKLNWKRWIALFGALLMLCTAMGSAEGYAFAFEYEGEWLTLLYDTSEQYSYVKDGLITASFYTYTEDLTEMYEVFLMIPETAQAGDVITQDSVSDGGICYIHSSRTEEDYFYAARIGGTLIPESCTYTLNLTRAENGEYEGTLSAVLYGYNNQGGSLTGKTFEMSNATFRFSMNVVSDGAAAPGETPSPDATDEPGAMPALNLTPVPTKDLYKI